MLENCLDRAAVLARQALNHREALFERIKRELLTRDLWSAVLLG